MGIELDAIEVFEMAVRIEADARAFYERAASAATGLRPRRILLDLASMEGEHELIFDAMKTHFSGAAPLPADADDEGWAAKNLPTLVNLLASGVKEDLAQRFTGKEAGEQILRKAIEFEKDTIVFFAGMKAMLTDPTDKKRIDGIIKEELGHIVTLTSELATSRRSSTGASEWAWTEGSP